MIYMYNTTRKRESVVLYYCLLGVANLPLFMNWCQVKVKFTNQAKS